MWHSIPMKKATVIAACMIVPSLSLVTAQTTPFPFGNATGDIVGGALNVVSLTQTMSYVGSNITSVYQYTGGKIRLFDGKYAPAFEGDVSVYGVNGGGNSSEHEYWTRAGNRSDDLALVKDILAGIAASFIPQAVVVSTWYKVEPQTFDRPRTGKNNTFQLIMPYSDTGETWVIFAYVQLDYFSVPSLDDGASVGYFNGRPQPFFERSFFFINSTEAMMQLLSGSNCNRKGIYAYQVNGPNKPPAAAKKCGLFGLGIFCPLTLCGLFGRWFGFCPAA
jgi:Nidogen-like